MKGGPAASYDAPGVAANDITITQGVTADEFVITGNGGTLVNGGAGLNDTLDVEGHGNLFSSGKIVTNVENLPL